MNINYLENLLLIDKKCRNNTGSLFYSKDICMDIERGKTYCVLLQPFQINQFLDKLGMLVISLLNHVQEFILPKEDRIRN